MKLDVGADSRDMLGKVRDLPRQLRAGFQLGSSAWSSFAAPAAGAIVVAGVGASAIGGDLLRLYLAERSGAPVRVRRDYGLTEPLCDRALVVISSYSGNTQEALACLGDAVRMKVPAVYVTSGGDLLDEARRAGIPGVVIPGGLPPRASLGYSFSALLALAWRVGLCADPTAELTQCAAGLDRLNAGYSDTGSDGNPALRLAADLSDRVPVVYCANQLDAVGLRWKNQFCENAKRFATVSFLPEASHNDVMGWETGEGVLKAGLVVLRTAREHPKVAAMLALAAGIAGREARFCGEFWGDRSSLLSDMFSLILLGDYASVYLALARGVDPTPIATIDRIKDNLRRGQTESR
ncbi:MAG: bifunctional phosphoglucose/phosphomannose isomerase [bacterium]